MSKQQTDARERILQASLKMFAEKGFEGTTVRDICEEAKANVSLVSYYFGGKEKVLYALFETYFGFQLEEKEPEENEEDPVKRLSKLIRNIISFRMENQQLIHILRQETFFETARSERLRKIVLPTWEELKETLIIGREQGVFHFRSIDRAMMLVMSCIMMMDVRRIAQPLMEGEQQVAEEIIEDTIQFIRAGLCNP
ncbi:AcrR family transcriptional regulator [Croceifilum oryzae]|uniref:AcrR family transcriptional regulator n=1 Tax=Croceifilum oryzae TaxID=1553429 RepID=A0AAJ1WSL9_9BACL|nr:TetR/AcrR family transcriptional regulator [Croceifilum oryzae]MDQ0416096.1 AcrR family transcriptional regulator [Croceifilum oryzae]